MAILHPFRALRPVPDKVAEVASVPYDVVDTEEARALAEGRPLSFLHVVRPEIDLPSGADEYAPETYERGAANLRAFAGNGASVQDEPSVYIYRLEMDGHTQTGVFGCVSVEEYDNGTILKHEKTRPKKETDRVRHIVTQQAHAEPVMMTYRNADRIDVLVASETASEPLYDFMAEDGVRHTIWKAEQQEELVDAFERVEYLYIADGHHRCAAASRAAAEMRKASAGLPEAEFFPAVLFPMSELRILAYNRIVRKLPVPADEFLNTLAARFDLSVDSGEKTPAEPGSVCLYLGGHWHTIQLPPTERTEVADTLDVARLSEHLLEPEFGIMDQRLDPNIDFVGGIRGAGELERLVDSGRAKLAISMYPTSVEELLAVSNAGLLMPPKSTWFEPKLRSGLLVHLFDQD
ncbi:MAG: DUF1015 domain-containing protein [Bacteroidetes bacterium SB0662_bin_6]|nr:DUF1015 domain-containing protein [Bacteroidetes bacterium SB0668_bin_1]MYE05024.1 DUF1015 domain-containing protein [Bacteroidetes bacterium SB0662_bin_6]